MQLLSLNLLKDEEQKLAIVALTPLFYDYFRERHPDILVGSEVMARLMIITMLKNNNYIYYVQGTDGEVLGFVTMSINDQYGMVTPHLIIDYMYIKPEFRKSRVTALLFGVTGHVADTMELDCIGTTFIDSSNIKNATIVGGEHTASVFLYKRGVFSEKYKKYIKRYI